MCVVSRRRTFLMCVCRCVVVCACGMITHCIISYVLFIVCVCVCLPLCVVCFAKIMFDMCLICVVLMYYTVL